ncbi:YkgB family protein [Nocardia sp. NPDC006044]|uniref:YkgB family protein n=1 Tax=Nocardia sp. NPDC006044 TaxID=3364306 RepID=UPI003693D8ED
MATITRTSTFDRVTAVPTIGAALSRYGLALVIVWIGAMKFFAFEAQGIQPLVASSPLMSWLYDLLSVNALSAVLGVVEIAIGLSIAAWRFAPRVALLGSAGAVILFLTTLSFMLSAPGVWQPGYGFPFLGAGGGFLIKDLVLLGVSVATAGEGITALRAQRR